MVELKQTTPPMRSCYSALQSSRQNASPQLPDILKGGNFALDPKEALGAAADHEKIQALFPATYGKPRVEIVNGSTELTQPLRVGVVLSGGQAPGGHNVIAGLYDCLRRMSGESKLFGFLNGPAGVMNGVFCEIDDNMMNLYRNTGGFDMIASGRDKIEKEEQFLASEDVVTQMDLDGLIVIGGDDSNTNAALLAERFKSKGLKCKVIGCPKTIDGDLKNEYIPVSFGFDTACKTFSEQIGNVMSDVLSTQNYYDFVRLMGRSAANIALECALATRPNLCFIGEEVEAKKSSLADVTKEVVDLVLERAAAGKDFGVILLPEGLIEFIPEFNVLIAEINDLLASGATVETCPDRLTPESRAVFDIVPPAIQMQLMLDRDPHGNVQVAKIETEKLIAGAVAAELENLKAAGTYTGSFKAEYHSFGYEGRCALPSLFDANYCYALGYNAAALLACGETGMMSSVRNLDAPIEAWECGGVPTTMMMNIERRHGKDKPVIKKALVEMDQRPFQLFAANRGKWRMHDNFRMPGPIQFEGPGADEVTFTLHYELTEEVGRYVLDVDSPMGEAKGRFMYTPLGKDHMSTVQAARGDYQPQVPESLSVKGLSDSCVKTGNVVSGAEPELRELVKSMFPMCFEGPLLTVSTKGGQEMSEDINSPEEKKMRMSSSVNKVTVGVVFCGKPVSGCMSLLQGLLEYCRGFEGSKVVAFIGGIEGLKTNQSVEVTPDTMQAYLGQGGQSPFCGSRARLVPEDYDAVNLTCVEQGINGLVLVGGRGAANDAARLANHFKAQAMATNVLCAPACPSMSLKSPFVECTLGADTAVKTIGQLSGNLAIDGSSARKYWYFMTVDGCGSSFTTLEAALQTNPNVAVFNEEYADGGLEGIVTAVADAVVRRAEAGNNFGTVIIAEGLAAGVGKENDLASLVEAELKNRKEAGSYSGKFSPVCCDLGLQVRSGLPSKFDIEFGYTLGATCAVLLRHGVTGYMAVVADMAKPTVQWKAGGVPICALMDIAEGKPSVEITKLNLNSPTLAQWNGIRQRAEAEEIYMNPGPIQFHGSASEDRMKLLELEPALGLP